MKKIGFNVPHLTGRELEYIRDAVGSGKISGDGLFTGKCHQFFKSRYGYARTLLTTSCTDALEMAAILSGIAPGDEVIVPAFTFVSTANAFVLRGAKIVFADSGTQEPNLDVSRLEALITPQTKAIVPVHYAGVACDMDPLMALAKEKGIAIIEDNAQGIDSFYKGRPLGGIGDLSAFSFHETKNVSSGEGGMLVVNREDWVKRAEIIREKGTNRSAFFRGEVDKYNWVDVGSSFLPSDVIAAFLYAQLENLDEIQKRRIHIWNTYYRGLEDLARSGKVQLPHIPDYATVNGHLFYLVCRSLEERGALIRFLKERNIDSVFHYISLHTSPFMMQPGYSPPLLPEAQRYSDCLLRLPIHLKLEQEDLNRVIEGVQDFYRAR